MSEPFIVLVDCGAEAPIKFTIDEEYLQGSRRVEVQAAMADDTAIPMHVRGCGVER